MISKEVKAYVIGLIMASFGLVITIDIGAGIFFFGLSIMTLAIIGEWN